MMKRFEFIEHTADICIKAFGETLEEAFAVAAGAMFEIITDNAPIEARQQVRIEAESIDLEGLLVNLLSRLIVVFEVDDLVLKDFSVSFCGENRLEASAWGEKFIASRHGQGHHVKGVSYHMMQIVEGRGEEPSYVQVLFDV